MDLTKTALIIFGKIHFLLTLEKEFFHEVKCDEITSLHGIPGIILACRKGVEYFPRRNILELLRFFRVFGWGLLCRTGKNCNLNFKHQIRLDKYVSFFFFCLNLLCRQVR